MHLQAQSTKAHSERQLGRTHLPCLNLWICIVQQSALSLDLVRPSLNQGRTQISILVPDSHYKPLLSSVRERINILTAIRETSILLEPVSHVPGGTLLEPVSHFPAGTLL